MAEARLEAWALANLQNVMSQVNLAGKVAFMRAYERQIFPRLGTSTAQTKWWTYRNVTRVTIWGRNHFRNNVNYFRVLEALGLGSPFYCVQGSQHPRFSRRLLLLLRYLPHKKVYIYPYFGLPLRGPFDRTIHLHLIGLQIYRRRLPDGELPNYCPACNSHLCDHVMDGLTEI